MYLLLLDHMKKANIKYAPLKQEANWLLEGVGCRKTQIDDENLRYPVPKIFMKQFSICNNA